MIKKVFKYPIDGTDDFKIQLPKGAKILYVQTQNEIPYFWALVDPEAPKEERFFRLAGTGHPIHFDMGLDYNFIGSFLIRNDSLVFHLFEIL